MKEFIEKHKQTIGIFSFIIAFAVGQFYYIKWKQNRCVAECLEPSSVWGEDMKETCYCVCYYGAEGCARSGE